MLDHQIGAWKLDHEKGRSSMVRFHGPWWKPALRGGEREASRRKRTKLVHTDDAES